MSDMAAIREKLRAILASVAGINAASAYPPDSIGAVPAAFVGLNDVTINYSAGLEENQHTLDIVVLLERTAGRLPANVAKLEELEAAFRAKMRQNISLGNTVNLCLVTRIQQDTVQIGQTPYLGFVATLALTDKFGVSLSG